MFARQFFKKAAEGFAKGTSQLFGTSGRISTASEDAGKSLVESLYQTVVESSNSDAMEKFKSNNEAAVLSFKTIGISSVGATQLLARKPLSLPADRTIFKKEIETESASAGGDTAGTNAAVVGVLAWFAESAKS